MKSLYRRRVPLLEPDELELVDELDEELDEELEEDELELEVILPLELLDEELELDELLALGSPPQAVNKAVNTSVPRPVSDLKLTRGAAEKPARARAVRLFIRPSTRIMVVMMNAR